MPAGRFCVRCGEPQRDPGPGGGASGSGPGGVLAVAPVQPGPAGPGQRRRLEAFAAAPHERVLGPSLVSTLFPRLPRSHLASFRIGLAIGIGLVGGLVLAGFYPVALGVAAAIVPALIVVYIHDVDVYEGEPARVLAATVVWGVVTGGLVGFASANLIALTPGAAPDAGETLLRGVALPILGGALALVGPLVLLRRPAFNDVLDGVTFGAAAGSAFIGARTLAGASDLLSGGLRPVGAAGPWLVQLLTAGVAQPILSAAVAAIVLGTIWLRVRAPLRDRRALGPLGSPFVATVLGGAALAFAGLGRILLGSVDALLWLIVLAILAVLWMRLLIHIGLLEEAAEIAIGSPIVCPNCGEMTPHHTFCASCGISLRALPRSHRPSDAAPDGEGGPG